MQRYPLAWPTGWPRTEPHLRRNPKFTKGVRHQPSGEGPSYLRQQEISVIDACKRIIDQLNKLGVADGDVIISTNLKTRLDGLPRSDQRKPDDPGAAVYWALLKDRTEERKVLAIDAYNTVEGNLGALAATLEAMRAIERHGGSRILERAFTGFTALPAPGQTGGGTWRDVLGFAGHNEVRLSEVELAWKKMRSFYHPDKNGGQEVPQFHLVNKAWDQAQRELGNPA